MVIKGLETFRNHFKDYNDSYVILGELLGMSGSLKPILNSD